MSNPETILILTLTPNPSLDLLFTADRLVWDDANRVPMPRRRPGGQGINLVRAARALEPGAETRAIAPLGGVVGDEMQRMLGAEDTPLRRVGGEAGETRLFVGVRERGGDRSLLLNPRGPDGGPEVERALLDAVLDELNGHDGSGWLACCGSLLPGLSDDFYARAGSAAIERGWRFVPDCDGEALRLAAAAGADLLVPNLHEAERLLGRSISGASAAGAAARDLLDLGPDMAIITLAGAGAVAATADGCWWARLPSGAGVDAGIRDGLRAGSAVGAGDAFLAALLLDLGRSAAAESALAYAVAAGTGALLSDGSDLVRRRDVERVRRHVVVEPMGG